VIAERRPSPERLAALLAGAAALVHPALHEGSGLTLLEAMRAGVPVLAARSPGVVETCGEAAELFDPRDPAALAALLAATPSAPARRAALAERGRVRAAGFTWAASAQAHGEAYALALRESLRAS
jgi:glycosyltransferase involved in cell wall biosynthesis